MNPDLLPGLPTEEPTPPSLSPHGAPEPSARRLWPWVVTGLAALALGAGLGVFLHTRPEKAMDTIPSATQRLALPPDSPKAPPGMQKSESASALSTEPTGSPSPAGPTGRVIPATTEKKSETKKSEPVRSTEREPPPLLRPKTNQELRELP